MASEPFEQSRLPAALDWLDTHRYRLLKFAGVGISGVFVNLAVFTLTFQLLATAMPNEHLQFVLANAAGFVVSVFTNFLLNDWWTWGDRRKGGHRDWLGRLVKYYVTASGAGAVQLFTAWLSLTVVWSLLDIELIGIELAPILGVLTGIGCGMFVNFTASHLWAFRDASSKTTQ